MLTVRTGAEPGELPALYQIEIECFSKPFRWSEKAFRRAVEAAVPAGNEFSAHVPPPLSSATLPPPLSFRQGTRTRSEGSQLASQPASQRASERERMEGVGEGWM